MPATVDHPAFVQPDNPLTKIWRYIDFPKLISLLHTRCLHFTRIDQLGDPFEGSLSKTEFEHWQEVAAEGERSGDLPPDWKRRYVDVLLANARRTRRACYANCWHAAEGESDAMWRVYSAPAAGVAIQSTYRNLVDALPHDIYNGCYVGLVQYMDHRREAMPTGNAFYAVMHKRRAFAHEKELRAIVSIADRGFWVDPGQAANPVSVDVPVVLEDLVKAVFVSPLAPAWFAEAVSAAVDRFGVQIEVKQSELGIAAYL